MADGLTSVTQAKALAQSIDEAMFAEATLTGGNKEELLDLRQQIDMAQDQYDDAATQLSNIKDYFDGLVEILAENELPTANEKGASAIAESAMTQAKALYAKADEALQMYDKLVALTKELHKLGQGMLTETTALNGQIIIVMTRK